LSNLTIEFFINDFGKLGIKSWIFGYFLELRYLLMYPFDLANDVLVVFDLVKVPLSNYFVTRITDLEFARILLPPAPLLLLGNRNSFLWRLILGSL
jgi:hypothetical protein